MLGCASKERIKEMTTKCTCAADAVKIAKVIAAADAYLKATGGVCGVEPQRVALIAALNLFPQL